MNISSNRQKAQKSIIKVRLGKRSYQILIQDNILQDVGKYLTQLKLSKKIGIVTNPTVGRLYYTKVEDSLQKFGFDITQLVIPDGEAYKTLDSARQLYKKMLKSHFDRDSVLFALGGGVIGDLTGFVAATYMRGIPFIQIPTTLESQVDASVGGKVAVDLPEGKNLIGSFYQPKGVFIDTTVLKTLPTRELSSGLSEVIKYGVIWDKDFFDFLDDYIKHVFYSDLEVIQYIIKRSCEIKAEVVAKDETDKGLRNILNFGHTVGHAIETLTGYHKIRHGEAVAMGMMAESLLACKMGLLDKKSVTRIKRLIQSANLPVKLPKLNISKLIDIMHLDKKVKNNKIRMVLPTKIGSVKIVDNIELPLLEKVLHKCKEGKFS